MANTITFLKNYKDFGFKVRILTARSYLNTMLTNSDPQIKKVMMLRIIEELISSTEDLAMWLAAVDQRERSDKRRRDVWEYLLLCQANDEFVKRILQSVSKVKTGKGLLRKLNLPPLGALVEAGKLDEKSIVALLDKLAETIRSSHHNRTASGNLFIRFHNKVKHGMIVQDEANGLFIRDLRIKTGKTGRIIRKNRNIYLPLDEERAKKIVGTIEAVGYAVKNLSVLMLLHYWHKLKTRKRKLSKSELKFWEESLS